MGFIRQALGFKPANKICEQWHEFESRGVFGIGFEVLPSMVWYLLSKVNGEQNMAWPEPLHSKSQVKRAGARIAEAYTRDGMAHVGLNVSSEDYQIVENWRASHGAVLNTAQAWLRRLEGDSSPVVGQRLKRYKTIVDKISSGRSINLSSMHDIAGVRAIFRNHENLTEFRERMLDSRAKHKLQHAEDKYDYISSPKPTGYRGIHFAYARVSPSKSGLVWNGLKFEVQLRTAVQHAWATAVEVYDSTSRARYKFSPSDDPAYMQFLIISEIFARVYENRNSCLPEASDRELVSAARNLEEQTQMVSTIENLRLAGDVGALKKNTILQRTANGELVVHRFSSLPTALRSISEIEARQETVNAVLVGASAPQQIRDAFRNYFDDTQHFVELLQDGLRQIESQ